MLSRADYFYYLIINENWLKLPMGTSQGNLYAVLSNNLQEKGRLRHALDHFWGKVII